MRIQRLHLQNFRGFEEAAFTFDDHIAVVVGNNASGKTTLLQAVQVALGAFLSSLQQAAQLPYDKAYTRSITSRDIFRRFSPLQKDFLPNPDPTIVEALGSYALRNDTGTWEEREIKWAREYVRGRSTDIRRSAKEMVEYAATIAQTRVSDTPTALPVILSFGVNRIDNQYRAATKTRSRASRLERAYKSALQEAVDFRSAFDWLYRYDREIAKGVEFQGTQAAFIAALQQAIPALKDIHIDTKNHELSARVEITGQPSAYQTYDAMSDGIKAMINIVAEIAYRCVLLNGFLEKEAIRETPGVVVIDELDLYLHPRWQRHILHDLHEAFPKIQFIVSSHSPFIIQSVHSNNLITLDGTRDTTDPLYRSIEEIAAKEMNMPETLRSAKYTRMLQLATEFFTLAQNGKDGSPHAEELYRRYMEAEAEFSDNPAYLAILRAEKEKI